MSPLRLPAAALLALALAACSDAPAPADRTPPLAWTVVRDAEHLRTELEKARSQRVPVVVETWAIT